MAWWDDLFSPGAGTRPQQQTDPVAGAGGVARDDYFRRLRETQEAARLENERLAREAPASIGLAPPGGSGQGSDDDDKEQSWEDLIREFLDEMRAPLDFNDPKVAAILNSAAGRAERSSDLRGVHGPRAVTAGQQAYTQAAAGLDMQRRDAALRALGLGASTDLGQQGLGLRREGLDLDRYQLDLARYNQLAGSDPLTAGLSFAGGLLGAPFGQSQAFSNFGAGIGRSAYGSSNPMPSVPRPRYGGFGSSGGSGGY